MLYRVDLAWAGLACFYRKYIGKTFDPSLDIVRIIIGLNFIMYEFTNVWTEAIIEL
jgi:hypothetical protein